MSWHQNTCSWLQKRQTNDAITAGFQRANQVTPDLVQRIGLEAELEAHSGCVNCLEWNHKGNLLASGSDDVNVVLWDPFAYKALTTINTRHNGNIFSVKFLPNSNDSIMVTGAADCKIRVHDIQAQETTHVFSCHVGRVKRIATCPDVPCMFWSAAEDGTVMQFDLRTPEAASSGNPKNVLINLNAHMGHQAEAKCLAINPLRSEQLAVGANDPYVRLYDRRMLSCKSIKFPSDAASRSSWERENMLQMLTSEEEFSLPHKAVQYYIAGHLPQKQQDYIKRYRTLASTYLTFSPDGSELLVNLGGEQIYLFNINQQRKPQKLYLPITVGSAHSNGIVKESSNGHTNGFNIMSSNGVTNGVSKHIAAKDVDTKKRKPVRTLPPRVDTIKLKANDAFDKKNYNKAILLYNQAISMIPDSPILYGNRAAAYMKRGWDGDTYAALRDCLQATRLDQEHLKAHFRLAHCLHELAWNKEALDCLTYFKTKFPGSAKSQACENLDRDIKAAIYSKTETKRDSEPEKAESERSPGHGGKQVGKNISEQEKMWTADACDYELRFCGHCNTTTDIKEANFFGSNGQYIVAGSDDGSFFVWEKATTNIVRVLRGDESIVNCLQPHPTSCLLATSGIDPVVRLWSPRPETGQKDEREVDNSDDAASANQKRMNADPLEVMLMNMGYRLPMMEGEEEEDHESRVQCAPS